MAFTTFSGGIHPPENKRLSEGKAFSNLSVPQLCYIPLQQHVGKPARPIVEAGEIVREGQLIGLADGYISANVHASVPGKIVEITEHPTVYSKRGMCVVIEAQGSFPTSGRPLESADWGSMSNLELLNRVAEAVKSGQDRDRVAVLLGEVVDFTRHHFETEERLMERFQYPDALAHGQEHRKLLADLASIRAHATGASLMLTLQSLKEWLVSHIAHGDRELGEALVARGAAAAPAGPGAEPA